MKLTVWTYEGPPHVGAMRVATGMKGLHYVLHAPQGDTYADLLFTMIERRDRRPPVTYTTFQARDLGSDTANLFKTACEAAYERFQPQAMIVGASCTAELIQDDPGGMAETMGLPCPIVPLELPSYQRKENFGADETLFQLVRHLSRQAGQKRLAMERAFPAAAKLHLRSQRNSDHAKHPRRPPPGRDARLWQTSYQQAAPGPDCLRPLTETGIPLIDYGKAFPDCFGWFHSALTAC